jgi:hypothetical protein
MSSLPVGARAPATAPAASEFSRAASWTLGVSCVTLALAYGVSPTAARRSSAWATR